jgi:ribulose-5-phosphate 4-epimerase/fuculose-1-phosphate aldolase
MLGEAELMFMGNHGVITAAMTVPQAFDDLYFVERAAQTQIHAMSTGRPLVQLDQKMVEQVAAQTHYERFELGYIERHFAAQKRLLDTAGGLYRR